jgi:predicted Fe-Mo cluster-binding NifX family protein
MRIAIPVSSGFLEQHFGQCESLTLIDIEAEGPSIVAIDSIAAPEHAPGLLPRLLREHAVECVIAGNIGQRAQVLLAAASIEVVAGAPALAPDVLALTYLRGELASTPQTCNHAHEKCE